MRFPFIARGTVTVALPLVLLAFAPLAAIAACNKSSDTGPSAVTCPASSFDGGLPAFESASSGTVTGTGVNAAFCNVGVSVLATGSPTPPSVVVTLDSSTLATSSIATLPAGALDATLSGSVQIGSAKPGVYKSGDASVCGSFTFSYGVPTVAGVDCSAADAQAGTCPKGCVQSFVCGGSSPCCLTLAATSIFEAASGESCGGGTTAALGSWTLTLTSVVTADAGIGEPAYTAHGRLDATMAGTTGATTPVTLALTF